MQPLKIRIAREAYTKLFYFVDKCDVEIGFMGKVIFNPDKMSYDILSVYVPKQEVCGTSCDLDANAVGLLESETYKDKGHLNAWLHSHVNMGTFWSGTDRDTIKQIGGQGLCVAIVANKKREMRGAIYYKSKPIDKNADGFYPDFGSEGFYDEVKIEIIDYVSQALTIEWENTFEKNVTKKVYIPHHHSNYHTGADHSKWRDTQAASGMRNTGTHLGGVPNDDGVIPLSRKELKKLKKRKERATQLHMEGYVSDDPYMAQHNQTSSLGEPLYTDMELFHMSFTELAAELRMLKNDGIIDEQHEKEIQEQWRTCNVRLQSYKGAVRLK